MTMTMTMRPGAHSAAWMCCSDQQLLGRHAPRPKSPMRLAPWRRPRQRHLPTPRQPGSRQRQPPPLQAPPVPVSAATARWGRGMPAAQEGRPRRRSCPRQRAHPPPRHQSAHQRAQRQPMMTRRRTPVECARPHLSAQRRRQRRHRRGGRWPRRRSCSTPRPTVPSPRRTAQRPPWCAADGQRQQQQLQRQLQQHCWVRLCAPQAPHRPVRPAPR
mmetsp:Transcript_15244/g.57574  ORF Transcript_15244/g.57574 Transcript_15244/m.57574 type:complete len:215 (-) Transcript_15244:808-1452(-)